MSQLPLFVYGTLRKGEANHHYLAGKFTKALPGTLHGFLRMTAAHGFQAILRSPGDAVIGELYFLRPELYAATLQNCDILEDVRPGDLKGDCYYRGEVQVETDEGAFTAWAYIDISSPE